MNSELKTTDEKILYYHRYIEAFKFSNGLKKHLRDPKFHSDKVSIWKYHQEDSGIRFLQQVQIHVLPKLISLNNRQISL